MSHAVARPVLMPIGDIADLLAQHAEALAPDFLRGGRRDGGTWRAGSIGGEAGQSLCVWTRGTKQGQWHDFAAGRGGDMLDLAAACRFGGDMKEALRWARAWLGLDNIDPASFEIRQAQAAEDRAARAAEAEAQAEQKRRAAMRIWPTGTRMSCPWSVTSRISSPSLTGKPAARRPPLRDRSWANSPCPPRPVRR